MNNLFQQFVGKYSHGDNLSNLNDIKKVLFEINVSDKYYNGSGVPVYSDGETQYADNSEAHTLVFGATQSGKTSTICMPTTINMIRGRENIVVIDPKGDLYTEVYSDLIESGYTVDVINFRNLMNGSRYNPLLLPYNNWITGETNKMDLAVRQLNDIRHSLFSSVGTAADPFWLDVSGDIFVALALALFDIASSANEISIANAFLMLSNGRAKYGGSLYIKELFESFISKDSLAYTSFTAYLSAAEETRASMEAVFLQKMRMFYTSTLLIDLMSKTDVDVNDLTKTKRALFIILPDESKVYHPLASIIITQIYQELVRIAHDEYAGKLPNRINFIIEEFGNLIIKEVPLMLSAARSRNIRFLLLLQTEKQLVSNYKEDAQIIKSNCINWIYLYSRELGLLKELSELIGYKTIRINESNITVPLISVSQLQTLQFGQAIFFPGRNNATVTHLAPIWEYKYNTPKHEVTFRQRQLLDQDTFDIQQWVKDKKREMMIESFQKEDTQSSMDNKEYDEITKIKKPFPDFNIDELVKKIDERIANIDAESENDEDIEHDNNDDI